MTSFSERSEQTGESSSQRKERMVWNWAHRLGDRWAMGSKLSQASAGLKGPARPEVPEPLGYEPQTLFLLQHHMDLLTTPGLCPQMNPEPSPVCWSSYLQGPGPSPFLRELIHRLANIGISPRTVIFFLLKIFLFLPCQASFTCLSFVGSQLWREGFPHKSLHPHPPRGSPGLQFRAPCSSA